MQGEIPDIIVRCLIQISQVDWDGEWNPDNNVIGGCRWRILPESEGVQKIVLFFAEPWPLTIEFIWKNDEVHRMAAMELGLVYEMFQGFWMRA